MTTEVERDRRKRLKRTFIVAGGIIGMLLGAGYALLALSGRSLGGATVPPDPPSVICFNMFLILAACVLQASILGRLAGWMTGRGRG